MSGFVAERPVAGASCVEDVVGPGEVVGRRDEDCGGLEVDQQIDGIGIWDRTSD
jgi:hypothetical protein